MRVAIDVSIPEVVTVSLSVEPADVLTSKEN
jgi:hypothetical protein